MWSWWENIPRTKDTFEKFTENDSFQRIIAFNYIVCVCWIKKLIRYILHNSLDRQIKWRKDTINILLSAIRTWIDTYKLNNLGGISRKFPDTVDVFYQNGKKYIQQRGQ